MYKEIYEKMREKMGKKRYKGKRKIVIYRIQSLRQVTKNNIKYSKVKYKKMILNMGILYKDREIRITIWE